MRRFDYWTVLAILTAIGLLLFSCSENATSPQTISLEQAEGIILSTVLNGNDSGKVVYELPTQMKAGTIVYPLYSPDSVSYDAPTDSWFFFIDDKPGYRWAHPCRYAFVCCSSGIPTVYNESFPPDNADSLSMVLFDSQ